MTTTMKLLLLTTAMIEAYSSSQNVHNCNSTIDDIIAGFNSVNGAWTCANRCDETYSSNPCACDAVCEVYGDCCDDFADLCPSLLASTTATANSRLEEAPMDHSSDSSAALSINDSVTVEPRLQPNSNYPSTMDSTGVAGSTTEGSEPTLRSLLGTAECRHRARLISRCPQPPVPLPTSPLTYAGQIIRQEEVVSRCDTPLELAEDEDVLQAIPVTDSASGFHMANVYCLLCHGGRLADAVSWTMGYVWHMRPAKGKRVTPQSVWQLLRLARQLSVKTVALSPPGVTARRCMPPGTFPNFHCPCPRLARLCATAQDAYINLYRVPFRNTYCMLCYLVHTKYDDSLEAIIRPDLEAAAATRNGFEFFVTMRWTTASSEKKPPAKMVLGTPPSSRWSFDWTEMTCDINPTPTPRQHSNVKPAPEMEDERGSSEATAGNFSCNDHEKNAQGDQDGDGDLVHSSLTSAVTCKNGSLSEKADIPQKPASAVNASNEERSGWKKEARLTARGGRGQSVLESAEEQTMEWRPDRCRQERCGDNIPKVNGECSSDYNTVFVNVLMTCWPHQTTASYTTVSNVTKPDAISLASDVITNLTLITERAVSDLYSHNISLRAWALHSEDGCFWNATVAFLLDQPRVRALIYDDVNRQTLLANLTYTSLQQAAGHVINANAKAALYVCGRSIVYYPFKQTLLPQNRCHLSTVFLSPGAANPTSTGTVGMVKSHTMTSLLLSVSAVAIRVGLL